MRTKPKNVTWTDAQWRAITEQGHDLLVAAAPVQAKRRYLLRELSRN
ncbi:hypothetical protein NBRC111894_1484 [Sporolactobacillus inulinus]|uniref:Uncharacterized protein n=1 Tax=Sporolactobacillus inulinus TaxID=2078 RepID=A0A4Y1ZA76_9BACL|nr:hypothetical protein [Sporolactobacillus inulinus]GAY75930.1 hypothetical protein NBRC111894_1484 [Sporolactobacillus inulinus]